MAQSLETVKRFFENADAYAGFLARVEAAIVAKAMALREAAAPSPVTAAWVARQNWAVSVLSGAASVERQARAMLPALAVKANNAGLLVEDGTITATDQQIVVTIDDDFIDVHAGYVPEAS